MPDLLCGGPGPHDPEDGILGTTNADGVTGLCPLCASLNPEPISRPALEPEIAPEGSPRDTSTVRERTI